MAAYRVNYQRKLPSDQTEFTSGRVTVTATEVQFATKVSLLPSHIFMWLYAGGLILVMALPLLGVVFSPLFTNFSLAFASPWVVRIGLFLWVGVIVLGSLPLRTQRRAIPREEILGCAAQGQKVWLQTATRHLSLITNTATEAQTLADAIRDGAATPLTLPMRAGRATLRDQSQFHPERQVTITVEEGTVTLVGTAKPGTGRTLATYSLLFGGIAVGPLCMIAAFHADLSVWIGIIVVLCMIAGLVSGNVIYVRGKREVRTFPLSALREVMASYRSLTVLVPDEQGQEWRYVLRARLPEDITTLACRLRGETSGNVQLACRLPKRLRVIQHDPWPGEYTLPGELSIEQARVTFLGRSGLPHPWASRLAFFIALVVYLALIPYFWWLSQRLNLDLQSLVPMTFLAPMLFALLFAYLPASALLSRLLGKRVSVPRRQIADLSRHGRLVTLRAADQRVTFAAEDDATAEELVITLRTH